MVIARETKKGSDKDCIDLAFGGGRACLVLLLLLLNKQFPTCWDPVHMTQLDHTEVSSQGLNDDLMEVGINYTE